MTWQARDKTKKDFKARAINKHVTDVCIDASLHGERTTGHSAVAGPIEYHKWYASITMDADGYIRSIK